MQPPWVERPEIPFMSIGWRMGYGEDYAVKFDRWYKALTVEQRTQYELDYPEPPSWPGFYEGMRAHLDSWRNRRDQSAPNSG